MRSHRPLALALLTAAFACGDDTPPAADDTRGPGPVDGISAAPIGTDGFRTPLDAAPSSDGSVFYFIAQGRSGAGLFKVGVADHAVVELFSGPPLASPRSLAVASDDAALYVADPDAAGGGALLTLALGAQSAMPTVVAGTVGLHPRGVEVARGAAGDLVHFTGTDGKQRPGLFRIARAAGASVEPVYGGDPLRAPDQIAVATDGTMYVTDLGPSGTANLVRAWPGAAAVMAKDLRVDGPVGVGITLDGQLVLVSGLSAATGHSLVHAVSVRDGAVVTFDQGIGQNTSAGGLHRARLADTFGWADRTGGSQGKGTVYRVTPAMYSASGPDAGAGAGPKCLQAFAACGRDRDCCPGLVCMNGKCSLPYCGTDGSACTYDSNCCFSYSCIAGKCRSSCSGVLEPCIGGATCCPGLSCVPDPDSFYGTACHQAGACGAAGAKCAKKSDCCLEQQLDCQGGACVNVGRLCGLQHQHCYDSSNCCSGLACQSYLCEPPVNPGCAMFGTGKCNANGDCCSGHCVNHYCAVSCGVSGVPCAGDGDCCSGLKCAKGACRPTKS